MQSVKWWWIAAVVCLTAVGSLAQQSTSATETKAFEVLAVDGNVLVVRLPEGTREITVPSDFRFTVNGQQMSVRELMVGMKGTATITTRTTVTPVTRHRGKERHRCSAYAGSSIMVRTDEGVRSFTQSEVDKRGVKIYRNGKPMQLSELREGDRLSATIVTSQPPRVVTEKEVQATTVPAAAPPAPPAATRAAAAPAPAPPPATPGRLRAPAARAEPTQEARATLPRTASSWPLLGLASTLLLAMGVSLTVRRRRGR